MDEKITKSIWLIFAIIIVTLIAVYAINVFLLAFAAILLAILLNAIGRSAQKITRLPYPLALILALIVLLGILALIVWLYSPLIAEQFQNLTEELPKAVDNIHDSINSFFKNGLISEKTLQKEFLAAKQTVFSKVVTVFSFTIGSIVSFVIFLFVGLYLAMDPQRYVHGIIYLIPSKKQSQYWSVVERIATFLRWWLVSKMLAMLAVGILTYIGLWLMNVSLAFILGLLMALLTFIPYVGPILASIPAILVAFAQSPLLAVYVTVLYLGIHMAEGYLITPYIEQKTVSLPPALTIMTQVLMVVLVGGLGLALATPLTVVAMALAQYTTQKRENQIS